MTDIVHATVDSADCCAGILGSNNFLSRSKENVRRMENKLVKINIHFIQFIISLINFFCSIFGREDWPT